MTLRHLRNEITVACYFECANVRAIFRRVDPDLCCRRERPGNVPDESFGMPGIKPQPAPWPSPREPAWTTAGARRKQPARKQYQSRPVIGHSPPTDEL